MSTRPGCTSVTHDLTIYTETFMEKKQLLDQVMQAVRSLEPSAEVILYGSRSRGDASPESDWDFLVIVEGPCTDERTDRIRHRLYELEWEAGEVLSAIVRSRAEWNSNQYLILPFHQQISREGVRL